MEETMVGVQLVLRKMRDFEMLTFYLDHLAYLLRHLRMEEAQFALALAKIIRSSEKRR
jgi:hypothetical protein